MKGYDKMANKIISGLGFHHIALKAADFDKSYEFYTKLGFEPFEAWGEGDGRAQMFDMGDGSILELFAGAKDIPDTGKFLHFAMKCDDVEKAYDTALAAGARPITPPKCVPLNSTPKKMTLQCAFVYGPDNEQLEFFKIVEIEA